MVQQRLPERQGRWSQVWLLHTARRLLAACFDFARLVSQAFSPNNRYWRWLVGWLFRWVDYNADFVVLQGF